VAFDEIGQNEATGRFVIVDGYDIAGGGIVSSAEKDEKEDLRAEARLRDFHWIRGGVSPADRARRFAHRAALVMFVGKGPGSASTVTPGRWSALFLTKAAPSTCSTAPTCSWASTAI
jgi:hypothetical protein